MRQCTSDTDGQTDVHWHRSISARCIGLHLVLKTTREWYFTHTPPRPQWGDSVNIDRTLVCMCGVCDLQPCERIWGWTDERQPCVPGRTRGVSRTKGGSTHITDRLVIRLATQIWQLWYSC